METIKVYATNRDGTPALWLEQSASSQVQNGCLYLCDDNGRFVVPDRVAADKTAAEWLAKVPA